LPPRPAVYQTTAEDVAKANPPKVELPKGIRKRGDKFYGRYSVPGVGQVNMPPCDTPEEAEEEMHQAMLSSGSFTEEEYQAWKTFKRF
jgi:hypothetical protein